MLTSRALLASTGAAVLLASLPNLAVGQDPPVQAYRELDGAVVARNVLPPGQGHHLRLDEQARASSTGEHPPHNVHQISLYEDLIAAAPDLTDADNWFPALTEAVFRPVLGSAFDEAARLLSLTERARPGGSSYFGGWHGQLHRDLRQVLGQPVTEPASRTYCGAGDRDACRDALLTSLDDVLTDIEDAEGPDPTDWDFDESSQRIRFSPLDVTVPAPMEWQNRPTFQQVLSFGAPRDPDEAQVPEPEAIAAPLPTTGGGAALVGVLLLLLGSARGRRGHRWA